MKLAVSLLVLAACAQESVTAIEVHAVLPAGQGLTQLQISGSVNDEEAFVPGVLPEVPRTLDSDETAIVLVDGGMDEAVIELSVGALANGHVVMSAVGTVEIERGETRRVDILLDDDDPVPSAAALVTFGFSTTANAALTSDVSAAILGSNITAALPSAADLKTLTATYDTISADTTVAIDGVEQTSGVTVNNFASTRVYRVRTAGGATRDYSTDIKRSSSDKPGMLAFGFTARDNPELVADAIGTISNGDVTVHVPPGTNTSALVATYAALGDVAVDGVPQSNASTINDFGASRSYVLTTTKGSTTFTVAVVAN